MTGERVLPQGTNEAVADFFWHVWDYYVPILTEAHCLWNCSDGKRTMR